MADASGRVMLRLYEMRCTIGAALREQSFSFNGDCYAYVCGNTTVLAPSGYVWVTIDEGHSVAKIEEFGPKEYQNPDGSYCRKAEGVLIIQDPSSVLYYKKLSDKKETTAFDRFVALVGTGFLRTDGRTSSRWNFDGQGNLTKD